MNLEPGRDARPHHLSDEDELNEALDPVIMSRRLAALNRSPQRSSVFVPSHVEIGDPVARFYRREPVVRWTERDLQMREAEPGCLAQFLKLKHPNKRRRDQDGSDALLSFVRKWGVLGLQPMLTPMEPYPDRSRRSEGPRLRDQFIPEQIGWVTDRDHWYEEPVSSWHDTVLEMNWVLRVAKSTQEGRSVGEELFQEITSVPPYWDMEGWQAGGVIEAQRKWVQLMMADWLASVRIKPTVAWTPPKGKNKEEQPERLVVVFDTAVAREELVNWDNARQEEIHQWDVEEQQGRPSAYIRTGSRPSPLLGLLAVELMTAITSSDHWHQCEICLAMYPHDTGRRLRKGATPVCEDCQYDHHNRIQRASYHRTHPREQQQE